MPDETALPANSPAAPPLTAAIPESPLPTAPLAEAEPAAVVSPEETEPPLLEPIAAAPAPPPASVAPIRHPFIFHGEAREYFRIWIVNTLLTLLTCGIFVAWAKVRKRRYIRGNVELMGHRFDYRARPLRILAGNAIVAALFVAYSFFGQVYWQAAVVAAGIAALMLPWIVVRSLAFNAHNTSYRGMRFYFHQTYGAAAMLFFGQGLLVIFSLGFYYPAWMRNRREFTINHHRLGDSFFRFTGKNGPFYRIYLVAGVTLFGAVLVGGIIAAVLAKLNDHTVPTLLDQSPFFLLYGVALWFARSYLYAELFNQVWNNTRLDDHRFVANMNVSRWIDIQFGNLLAIVLSCGLLYPWATIRATRYALSCVQFEPAQPIEKISALGQAEGNALGDSAGEFIGMDFGL